MTQSIPGYEYGSAASARSPMTPADLDLLHKAVLFTDEDRTALRQAGAVLADQVEDVLDVWYGFVGANAHLVASFAGPDGAPNPVYLAAVRKRFGQWIRDTCERDYDQTWLDYQEEIAQRHYRTKKNRTDGVESTPLIPMRYMIAFIYPITATMRPFLEKGAESPEQLDRMHHAWFKAVVLQTALWCRPYAAEKDF